MALRLPHARSFWIVNVSPPHLSRAAGSWANGVSLFRINVRLSGRQKCHSVILPWYQMKTS